MCEFCKHRDHPIDDAPKNPCNSCVQWVDGEKAFLNYERRPTGPVQDNYFVVSIRGQQVDERQISELLEECLKQYLNDSGTFYTYAEVHPSQMRHMKVLETED